MLFDVVVGDTWLGGICVWGGGGCWGLIKTSEVIFTNVSKADVTVWRMQFEIGCRNLGLDLSHNGHLISALAQVYSDVIPVSRLPVSLDPKFRDSSALVSRMSRSHHIKYDITNSYQASQRQVWHLLSDHQNLLNLLTFNLCRHFDTKSCWLHNCTKSHMNLWITHHHLGTFRSMSSWSHGSDSHSISEWFNLKMFLEQSCQLQQPDNNWPM